MKALVTGLSESKFFSNDFDLKVGVNNCPFPVDHLIVADHPNIFDKEKRKIILNHSAKLFSHIPIWSQLRKMTLIKLATGRSNLTELKYKDRYCHSITSPFMAVVHAFYQGATEIYLAGVDIIGHPNLGKPDKIQIIRKDFKNLSDELEKNNCKLFLYKSIEGGVLNDILKRSDMN